MRTITLLIIFLSFQSLAYSNITISDVHNDMRNNLGWSPNELLGKDIIIDLGYTVDFCANVICFAEIKGVNYHPLYLTREKSIYSGMDLKGKTVTYDGIQNNFMTFKIK